MGGDSGSAGDRTVLGAAIPPGVTVPAGAVPEKGGGRPAAAMDIPIFDFTGACRPSLEERVP